MSLSYATSELGLIPNPLESAVVQMGSPAAQRIARRYERRGAVWAAEQFRSVRAFTRIELATVLGAAALLIIVMLPVLANSNSASERAICYNNLRLIGGAVHGWAADSPQNRPAWWTPVAAGGTYYQSKFGNAWFEFLAFSNCLSRPQLLACPADAGVLPARDWQEFYYTRQSSVSYVVGLHAGRDPAENGWLSGDRNVRSDGDLGGGCVTGVNNASYIWTEGPTWLQWTNSVHGDRGHILLYGGAVEFTDTHRLRELLQRSVNDDYRYIHFLRAR